MSRSQLLWLLDRIPRYASLLGLLGLIGLAGVFDPTLYRLSALSFLSYLAFFRFFRRFLDPDSGPTAQSALFLLPAFFVAVLFPWLVSIAPWFGFVGFAGWCARYDPAPTAPRTPGVYQSEACGREWWWVISCSWFWASSRRHCWRVILVIRRPIAIRFEASARLRPNKPLQLTRAARGACQDRWHFENQA
jgi:hypothetical protein